MGTGYTRNDTINNIADGNIINAADFDGEYDAIEAAFNSSTGHSHDGTSGEGGPVTVLGPAQDFVASTTDIKPKTNNTLDIGTTSLKFKDMYLAGTANLVNITTTGDVTLTGAANNIVFDASDNALEFADNAKATFGDDGDLEIYHDPSSGPSGNSIIADTGAGALAIRGSTVQLEKSDGSELMASFVEDGASTLYYDNVARLATTATGIAVTGSIALDGIHLDDNEKATFGDSTTPDLEIYHNGTNSIIENNTGELFIQGNNITLRSDTDTETFIAMDKDGAVELYHDNVKKFDTDADGVNVTGQIDVSTDLNVTGDADIGDDLSLSSDAAVINIGADGDVTLTHEADTGIQAKAASGFELNLQTGDTAVESGEILGKITFNAPDEASGGDAILDGAAIEAVAEDTFASDNNTTALVFKTNTSGAATERMRIKGDGTIIMDTQVDIDNITINGNTISSTDTNGNIIFATNGTGDIVVNDDIISTTTNQDITLTPNGTGSVDISKLKIASGATAITSILDEDDLTSDSDTALATQQSVKAYVDGQIAGGSFTGGITVSGGDIQLAHDNAVDFKDSTDTFRVALKKSADPTADHDITLPNVTGKVITTGNTEELAINGLTALTDPIADADEMIVYDASGAVNVKATFTQIKTYLTSAGFSQDDPTALAIALG